MAESYSDEHVLAMYIGALAEDDRAWVKTARRLMRERDEARREALEEAAVFAEEYIGAHPALVERIRALKDKP
jgi:hypothetical protein